jgi:hypothetical protein
METLQVGQKDQWTIQGSTPDSCKWYFDRKLRSGISERLNIKRVIPYKEPTAT